MADTLVNGIRLHYEVHGEGDPLVLAHGFGASLEMWAEQIGPFSQKYRVVVYDMRGHGRTEAPRDLSSYTLDEYVEDQRQLMDHLGIDTAYVGGLSMGGGVALRFALTHPQRVKALLLCDTSARNYALQGDRPAGMQPSAPRRFLFRNLAPEVFVLARHVPFERLPRTHPVVKSYLQGVRQQTAHGLRGGWRALMEQEDLEGRLGEITAPTLIIVGDRDPLQSPSRVMQRLIPGCRFVLIKDSGHGTAGYQPEAFNRAVLEFLDDVETGRPIEGEMTL